MYREILDSNGVDFSKLTVRNKSHELIGLVPAIIVSESEMAAEGLKAVRMVGFMNRAALDRTFQSGLVTFYSRTRNELWLKGENSGNTLAVKAIYADCDNDTLLLNVIANGPTCHTGADSCFELPEPSV